MKVMIFTRPSITNFYVKIFEKSLIKKGEKYFITEYFNESKILTNCLLLKPIFKSKYDSSWMIFSDDEIFDIITRDRYLTKVVFEEAVQLVKNVICQLLHFIDSVKPDILTGHTTDYYTVDIYYRLALKLNIKCFSMVVGPKGTFKFIDYRLPIKRKNLNTNVDLYNYINKRTENNYTPNTHNGLIWRLRKYIWIRRKQILMYNYLNPDVRNYNTDIQIVRNNRMALPQFNVKDLLKRYYCKLEEIPKNHNKTIYVSLHYSPEATMNYYSENNTLFNHDQIVLELLNKFNSDFTFVIKEHPAMFGLRKIKFYENIKNISNCYLINPYTNAYKVVENSDVVLSWAGSIGWEAPFMGRETINIIKPYYAVEGVDNYFLNYKDLIENFTNKINNISYSNDEYCSKLNQYFQSVLYDGIPISTFSDIDNINKLSKSINTFLSEQ